jgi:hypothetical protein
MRTTVAAFPAESPSYAYMWLAQRATAVAVGGGLLALVLLHAPQADWRRLYLLGVGAVCATAWVSVTFTSTAAAMTLMQGVALGSLFAVAAATVSAIAGCRQDPGTARERLPWGYAALLPAIAGIAWGWPATLAGRHGNSPAAGTLLVVAMLVGGIRLAMLLARARREAIRDGRFRAQPAGSPAAAIAREAVAVAPWVLAAVAAFLLWLGGIGDISPPLQ